MKSGQQQSSPLGRKLRANFHRDSPNKLNPLLTSDNGSSNYLHLWHTSSQGKASIAIKNDVNFTPDFREPDTYEKRDGVTVPKFSIPSLAIIQENTVSKINNN